MRVLALDPGEKVGWASVDVETGQLWEDARWQHGIWKLREGAEWVLATAHEYDRIVYETWRLRPDFALKAVGSDFPSVQFVGMIRLAAWNAGVKLSPQAPLKMSTARKTLPPVLQDIVDREPARHDDSHNVSAILHLWYWLWKNYGEGSR